MLLHIISSLFGLLFLLVAVIYIHRKRNQRLLKSLGISGPEPHWLFGNLLQMSNPPMYELIPIWTKKYGKIWGYYEGPTPVVVISDADLLQEVFVKQFKHFYARKEFPVQENPDKSKKVSVFIARGERWKRLRSTLNPTFTEARMRQMFPLIDNCIDKMLLSIHEDLIQNPGSDVDIYKYFQVLTLDSICECAFGMQLNAQNNSNSIVIEKLRLFFNDDFSKKPIMVVGMVFPEVRYFLNSLMSRFRSASNPISILVELVKEVIKQRREVITKEGAPPRVDLLQLLLDAQVSPSTDDGLVPTNTIDQDVNDAESDITTRQCPVLSAASLKGGEKKRRLHEEEIIAQAVLFLVGGYETSSTALAYCVYELVQHPQVLDRLHDEIDSAMQDLSEEDRAIGSVNFYKAICRLPYLEGVIWETLRYHPFVGLIINRKTMSSDVKLGGITLPKGVAVAPDSQAVHFNQDLWGPIDVHKFDPDRHLKLKGNGKYEFSQREHAMAMLGFGAGPKNCIGQRFALMEMRACLVRFLMKFTIRKGSKTPEKLPLRLGTTVAPRDGVWLEIQART